MTRKQISIVIPAYNDPKGLQETLIAITDQTLSKSVYEVLVVDNDSTDTTPSVIEEYEQSSSVVTGLEETNIQSSYAARNTGIEHATGKIIVFLDADETVDTNFVANIQDWFSSSDVDYLGCNVEMYIPEEKGTFWARYDVAMGLPVKHYLKTKGFAPTCALAVRREVFDNVGLFDETLVSGGDKEFGQRVLEEGFTMGFANDITVHHPARTILSEHIGKAKRIGKGQAQLWRSHKLASNPFSLVRILPPSPQRIQQRTRHKDSMCLIYMTAYIFKIIQTISAVRYVLQGELLKQQRQSHS